MTKAEKDAVEYVVSLADSYIDDLDTGLEDGIYEEGEEHIEGYMEACDIIDKMLKKPTTKK